MQPRMTEAELRLFESFARCADSYLEFGSGGSTVLATNLVGSSVISVDSSQAWQTKVKDYCAANDCRIVPSLYHVDIGPTTDWGHPDGSAFRQQWPSYHEAIWQHPEAVNADLFLVDGRFRVACFLQTVLHCEADSVILFHDFSPRPEYAVVREVAREITSVGELSAFIALKKRLRAGAVRMLNEYRFDPT